MLGCIFREFSMNTSTVALDSYEEKNAKDCNENIFFIHFEILIIRFHFKLIELLTPSRNWYYLIIFKF